MATRGVPAVAWRQVRAEALSTVFEEVLIDFFDDDA